MKIHQLAFIRDLVIEQELTNCNANVNLIKAGLFIKMIDLEDHKKVDLHKYYRLIGKLMYLSCRTKSNITFVVGQLSRHNTDSKKRHLRTAKRVVRYLKETANMGLIFQ